MSNAALYASPEMVNVFDRVWGADSKCSFVMPQVGKYDEEVRDFMVKVDGAHKAADASRLVFG